MPHLFIDYAAGLEAYLDMGAFCAALRDALAGTGVFSPDGIRVRAHRADHAVIADGAEPYGYIDMILRIGAGREAALRERVAEEIYAAAEREVAAHCAALPVMLSLEVQEIAARFSVKRLNTVRSRIDARGGR
ncbi:MAG: 5-carboxymethyl-2-hydroxymuconate Delta-isomerase [Alphaproteobacteria bacterium]|nr:MAG: 5-carboxymethyl-2-hydroxymuconate Delta-isomerase [Alphaproteobacteria bacterium]